MELQEIKATIAKAIIRSEAVRFIYVTPSKVSIRTVWPHKWKYRAFLAFDFGRNDLREFKIDNIYRIELFPSWRVFFPVQITEIAIRKEKDGKRKTPEN